MNANRNSSNDNDPKKREDANDNNNNNNDDVEVEGDNLPLFGDINLKSESVEQCLGTGMASVIFSD